MKSVRSLPRPAAIAAGIAALAIGGCREVNWSGRALAWRKDFLRTDESRLDESNHDRAPATQERSAQEPPAGASGRLDLASDAWVRTLPAGSTDRGALRWHNPPLDWLLELAPARRGEYEGKLDAALAGVQPLAAANAAIVLGRWKSAKAATPLAAVVADGQQKPQVRAAAAESLGKVPNARAATHLQSLLDEFGNEQAGAAYLPNLHAELLYALAHHPAEAADARFVVSCRAGAPIVRQAAVSGLGDSKGPLTPAAVALRLDSDARVRACALRTIVLRRHPEAVDFLERALNDAELSVRLAAVAGLGEIGGEAARRALERLRENPSEALRVAVVTALAAQGADEQVIASAADKSWRVRQAVADALAQAPRQAESLQRQTILQAEELLRDASAEVRAATTAALERWPIEQAGPLLLAAMNDERFSLRKAAVDALARRWPPAAQFQPDAAPERRQQQWAELRERFESTYGSTRDALLAAASAEFSQATGVNLADIRQVASQYASMLEDLRAANPADRRAAIAQLVHEAAGDPLPPEALEALLAVLTRDSDPALWQLAMSAIRHDARETAFQLAQMAIGNASAEVRRRACDYLATHSDPRRLAVLIPALADPDTAVVIAALAAVAAVGAIDDPTPVVELLGSTNRQVRLAAARCAAQLHLESGAAALERLALDADHDIRRATAAAMGELAERTYLPTLIACLDDRSDVQQAALVALAKIAGRDVGQDAKARGPLPPAEQCRRWKAWFREQSPTAR